MKAALWIIAGIVVVLSLYVVVGRALLKRTALGKRFFGWIEPIEIALWKKSETILASRLLSWGGGLVTAYDLVATFATGLDLTPVSSRLLADIPPDIRPLVVSAAISAVGGMFEWLRRTTTRPLELVALPESKPLPPEVVQVVRAAERVKEDAVAVVAEAKKEGDV